MAGGGASVVYRYSVIVLTYTLESMALKTKQSLVLITIKLIPLCIIGFSIRGECQRCSRDTDSAAVYTLPIQLPAKLDS